MTPGWPPISNSYHSLTWISLLQVNIQITPQKWSGLSCQVSVNPFWAKRKELSPHLPKKLFPEILAGCFLGILIRSEKLAIRWLSVTEKTLLPDFEDIWLHEYWWFLFTFIYKHVYIVKHVTFIYFFLSFISRGRDSGRAGCPPCRHSTPPSPEMQLWAQGAGVFTRGGAVGG